jgi:hypothetical protein
MMLDYESEESKNIVTVLYHEGSLYTLDKVLVMLTNYFSNRYVPRIVGVAI